MYIDMRMYNCMIVHEYCFYCLLQFSHLCKSLPTLLMFLYPRTWKMENQVWGWPGLLSKMLQISQSIAFNTAEVGIYFGAIPVHWAFSLIQLLPFCLHFFLVLNTMLEWKQCLLLEMESGVKCTQRQLAIVSLFICMSNCVIMWYQTSQ